MKTLLRFFIVLAFALSFKTVLAQNDYSIIHFYRVNSLREPKNTEFEIFLNDKQAPFLLGIGARVDFKVYSQGELKVAATLSAAFRKTCNTLPIYFDVVPGEEYYVRVDGVSCICLKRLTSDGERDYRKEYDFSVPIVEKEEDRGRPYMKFAEKIKEDVSEAVKATTGLSTQGYANKYALIIGNSAYPEAPLRNPANDARAISNELKKLNFKVFSYTNLTKVDMKEAIRDFEDKIRNNKGVAVFYYAGHGLQSNGANWLVPIDAKIEREYDIEDVCVKGDMVLRMLELNENPMNIVILDACRNNPYAVSGRSLSRGLAQPENAPKGSIIAFATAPGKTASDGDGDNGLYTQELIKALREPGLSVEQVFKQVRVNVIKLSNNQQTPWENSSLLGDFYFRQE